VEYRLNVVGDHWVINSLCILAAVAAAGGDIRSAADSLAEVVAPKGRGRRSDIAIEGGTFGLIDDSYNASPVSMAASFEVLGHARIGPGGRRIAVLGDMLELGDEAALLHAALLQPLRRHGVDLVFTAGPSMAHLFDALPPEMRGGHAADSQALSPRVIEAVRAGDVVTVKGSAGSRMGVVVAALRDLATRDGGAAGADRGE
jgi:UDP-N-acetylmuramoyl-tripeptide--D-alanyl-D-alanine ligase